MKVSIIPEDNIIVKDGRALKCSFIAPPNVRAIQWNGSHVETEFTDKGNEVTLDFTTIERYLEIYDAEAARIYAEENPVYSPEELLARAKEQKSFELNRDRKAALDAGVSYGGYTWDSDTEARNNLTGFLTGLQAGIPMPENFTWRTYDNIDVPLTFNEFVEFGAAMLAHVSTQYQKSWYFKGLVLDASTVADVEAIEWI